jgi:hypothetical protein
VSQAPEQLEIAVRNFRLPKIAVPASRSVLSAGIAVPKVGFAVPSPSCLGNSPSRVMVLGSEFRGSGTSRRGTTIFSEKYRPYRPYRPSPEQRRDARKTPTRANASELLGGCQWLLLNFQRAGGSTALPSTSPRVGDRGGGRAGGLETQPRKAALGILTARFQHQGLAPNFFAARRCAWFLVAW